MAKSILSADRLREVLKYDPVAGLFVNLVTRSNSSKAGQVIGCLDNSTGYLKLGLDGGTYHLHRLAWLYVTGEYPQGQIDHINGIRSDNRFCNLRDVPQRTNLQNRRSATPGSKSGLLGVYLHSHSGLWHATIVSAGKKHSLGYFKDKHEAHAAYVAAKRRLHEGNTL